MRRNLLLALACSLSLAAAAQPTWRFHLAFEDGTGARDTIWMVYDTSATTDTNPWPGPNVDTLLGEGRVDIDTNVFNVWVYSPIGDTSKARAYPYSVFPSFDGTIIHALNWTPPMTISWDTSLFHAPYLPYVQGSFERAIMDGLAFSQFGQSGEFGVFNMLIDNSVTVDFLWDYLFPFGVYFGPMDDTGIQGTRMADEPMLIWPNPANDKIWLRPALGFAKDISITDIAGQRMFYQRGPTTSEALDISMLPPGRYFIRILSNQNLIHHGTFEKNP